MSSSKINNDTAAVLQKISAMKSPFREMGQRLHKLILETVPELCPRVWYGMPGYAKSKTSPVLCYFRADRYMTFGLTEKAHFDFNGTPHKMCPTAWFFEELNEETARKVKEILRAGVE